MPVIRFTDPFMATPFEESFITSRGLANTSLTVGLNYKFSIDDIGGSFLPKDEDLYEIAIGFSLIPSFNFGPNSGSYIPDRASKIFSFSYAFPMQFYLSEHFAFESGLAIDNFNENNEYTTNVLIGIPITLRYYFSKNVEKGRAYYIDIGTHIDYHLNDGVAGTPVSYIMPLVLAKIGYEIKLGTNYFLNTDIGYEHELAYLRLSDNIGRAPAYNQLPYIFSGSIGFSYKFKKK
jgi:hypothetical protein